MNLMMQDKWCHITVYKGPVLPVQGAVQSQGEKKITENLVN